MTLINLRFSLPVMSRGEALHREIGPSRLERLSALIAARTLAASHSVMSTITMLAGAATLYVSSASAAAIQALRHRSPVEVVATPAPSNIGMTADGFDEVDLSPSSPRSAENGNTGSFEIDGVIII